MFPVPTRAGRAAWRESGERIASSIARDGVAALAIACLTITFPALVARRIERRATPDAPLPTGSVDIAIWVVGTIIALLAIRALVRADRAGEHLRVGAALRAVPSELGRTFTEWLDQPDRAAARPLRDGATDVFFVVTVLLAACGSQIALHPVLQAGVNAVAVDAGTPAAFGLWASDLALAFALGVVSGIALLVLSARSPSLRGRPAVVPVGRPPRRFTARELVGSPHITKVDHRSSDRRPFAVEHRPGTPEARDRSAFSVLRLMPSLPADPSAPADDTAVRAPISVAVHHVDAVDEPVGSGDVGPGLRWPPPGDGMRPPSTSIQEALSHRPERVPPPLVRRRGRSIPPPGSPEGD
jgi:hypothetical protein